MSETPGTIGRYEIRRELGRGTMGVVYEAWDPVLGRRVALKTIRLAFPAAESEREAFEQRFFTEARVAAGLQHPNVVVIHDFGRDAASGDLFMALEFLAGRPLSELALPLEPREALRLTARVAEALHVAHEQGVVHRDIKPANIMRLDSGEPKIMDFGIARAPSSDLTVAGQVFGTPANMSPEQARGDSLDGRSDLFSLGTVLYHLLTGARAFHAESLAGILDRVRHSEPRPASELVEGLPAGLDAVLARALAKDPAARYANGRAFAEDLEDVMAGRPPRHASELGEWTVVAEGAPHPDRSADASEETSPLAELVSATPVAATRVAVAAPAARTVPRPSSASRPARLAIRVALAALVVLAALLAGYSWLRAPSPGPAPAAQGAADTSPSPEAVPSAAASEPGLLARLFEEPARLAIDFEHPLKSGRIRVWVDDDLVLDEGLDGRVTRKLLSFTLRKGSIQQELEVSPGRRRVRVEVRWDDNTRVETITGTFRSGARRTLEARVGRLRKNLSLEWR